MTSPSAVWGEINSAIPKDRYKNVSCMQKIQSWIWQKNANIAIASFNVNLLLQWSAVLHHTWVMGVLFCLPWPRQAVVLGWIVTSPQTVSISEKWFISCGRCQVSLCEPWGEEPRCLRKITGPRRSSSQPSKRNPSAGLLKWSHSIFTANRLHGQYGMWGSTKCVRACERCRCFKCKWVQAIVYFAVRSFARVGFIKLTGEGSEQRRTPSVI